MLKMILMIAVLAIFFFDFCFFIYSFTAGTNRVIRKNPNRLYRFQCNNCANIKVYNDHEEYIRLKRKPRNSSPGKVSYRLPCSKCGKQTMQTTTDFPWRKEIAVWLAKSFGVVALIGVLCAIALRFIEKSA